MSLHAQILTDLTTAMKSQEVERMAVLRMIKAALLNASKEKKQDQEELSDEEVLKILKSEAKKRKESYVAFKDGGREDLAAKEESELKILDQYLPEQLSKQDVEAVVEQVVAEVGGDNFGTVMSAVMKKLQGQADGSVVKEVVQKKLAQ